jgi:hypothetical protein
MIEAARYLTALGVIVQGLAGDRAPALLSALAPAVRAAVTSSSADFAGLPRVERRRRMAALGRRAPDPAELATRLARLPPGLRAAVVDELPLALRPSPVPGASATSGEAACRWGARLACEWTAVRPPSAGAPSPRRDTRVPPVAGPPDWPAC